MFILPGVGGGILCGLNTIQEVFMCTGCFSPEWEIGGGGWRWRRCWEWRWLSGRCGCTARRLWDQLAAKRQLYFVVSKARPLSDLQKCWCLLRHQQPTDSLWVWLTTMLVHRYLIAGAKVSKRKTEMRSSLFSGSQAYSNCDEMIGWLFWY